MNVPEIGPSRPLVANDRLRVHPSPQELVQFLRGELSGADNRRIVRHLLAGCSTCVAVTAPVFRFAEDPLVRSRARRKTP
jgi:hypothetical protein